VGLSLERRDGKWWQLGLIDSATVASAAGEGAFVARRDRGTALSLLRGAVLVRVRLWMAWPSLALRYRSRAAALASADEWGRLWTTDSA
jgi:galactofuranosylgalactofuranosylrhamnosyl-N-acetylglucosaminyl-diphospho-decaprenol beta-1,5/1,6-galactofuranosyltransferase